MSLRKMQRDQSIAVSSKSLWSMQSQAQVTHSTFVRIKGAELTLGTKLGFCKRQQEWGSGEGVGHVWGQKVAQL